MKDESVRSYYEVEADDYNQSFYEKEDPYPTLRYRHNYILGMVAEMELPADAKVLDIGCGPGEMVIDLRKDQWELWGIDIAENMVNIAHEKLAKAPVLPNKVHFSVGDIENLDFPDQSLDLIVVSGVVEYLKDDEDWSRELDRVLKPGGYMVVNVTNKHAIRRWTAPAIEFLKRSKAVYGFANFVKEKVLRRGKLNYFPFRPRVHSPKVFDQFLADKGFEKISHNYFDFSIMPAPIDTLLGFVTIPIRKRMENRSAKDPVLWGTGYIVSARKA